MSVTVIIVVGLIVAYIVSEVLPVRRLAEGFTTVIHEAGPEIDGYLRDLRYTASHVDIQGSGYATDFCRAVRRADDPDSLHIACSLGNAGSGDIRSKTVGEGLRMSRDDYWARVTSNPKQLRMDYCRILRDEDTGEHYSSCIVIGNSQRNTSEEIDTNPPDRIKELLSAYEGIMTWFRWHDDGEDYAENADYIMYGRPQVPNLLNADLTRGLQLNRLHLAEGLGNQNKPTSEYLRWGERGTLTLDQTIQPRQIRAISFWIWWDAFTTGANVLECSNGNYKDMFRLGIEGGSPSLPPSRHAEPASELRPAAREAIGNLTEPMLSPGIGSSSSSYETNNTNQNTNATYVFEIWDDTQRIMRLEAPQGSTVTESWQHVAVTVTDGTDWWPTWQMWINGTLVSTKMDGRLSSALELKQNYIGKGVRGCIQDFRIYRTPIAPASVMRWSKPKLHPVP